MYVDRHPFRVLVGIAVLASALAADAACMEVIAHRGASGYLPEHTLPAYALGYGLGAHWIEPDVVLTADDVPTDDATLVARAHERGLLVHVFTLRADDERRGRFADEVIGLAAQGVDGVFTDHPDQVLGRSSRCRAAPDDLADQ